MFSAGMRHMFYKEDFHLLPPPDNLMAGFNLIHPLISDKSITIQNLQTAPKLAQLIDDPSCIPLNTYFLMKEMERKIPLPVTRIFE